MPGIIVGVDGSPHSQHALEWAMKEAAIRHAPLTVLTVHRASVGYWGSETRYPPDHAVAEHARQSAQDAVVKAAANLGEPGPESVTVHAVSGAPAEELITAGRDADMIVVGSRGAGGFPRLLIGSVSNHVTHHALCPVVVVPSEAPR